ncbi:phosphatase PAP2 family protein [Bradyrhizobium sp. S3.2.12]|uniref:phosphatase PAP2 family protein n=1 Tax=Bradyrhizobium sp. S3.2.12 TaxID=3156387 RepID=UPI00339B8AF2
MALESYGGASHSKQDSLTQDELVSLRLFQLNWALIFLVLVSLCLGLLLTSFRVEWSSYLAMLGMAGLYGIIGHLNERSAARNANIYATLITLAQFISMLVLLISLGYVAAAANLPMQEKNLLALDRMLGFDFRAYLGLVNDQLPLRWAFTQTYGSIHRQLLILMFILPLFGHHRRAAEFAFGFAIALIATTIISTLVPAIGAYHAVGIVPADHPNIEPVVYYGTLKERPLVRDGTTRLLNAYSLGSILTFPSFHAVCAVLYAWALWPFRWLRIAGLLWNVVMIAATPIGGGHFFADVWAGLVVALGSIYTVQRLGNHLAQEGRWKGASPVSQVTELHVQ